MVMEHKTSKDFYIRNLIVKNLWGINKTLNISFDKRVNIIVGPNATGKTTILNLIRYVFTLDYTSLYEIFFDEIQISLRSFDEKSNRTIKVINTESGLTFIVGNEDFVIDLDSITGRYPPSIRRRILAEKKDKLIDILGKLVPAVWLPVSRRLPISEDEERERKLVHRSSMESVDVRLRQLVIELKTYRLTLDKQIAVRYKDFEKQVMQIILYNKEFDHWDLESIQVDIQKDKDHLLSAYKSADLLDSTIIDRINEHFKAAEESRKRVEAGMSKGGKGVSIEDVFIVPLIRRTQSMIKYAQELEKDRDTIFAPLKRYERIVNSFIQSKKIHVDETGILQVRDLRSHKSFEHSGLSSGEKQILILMTQALLWEDRPVVYVVDEPELSLHVKWQEKFLQSLLDLGREIQIIAATHSPDIIGNYRSNVIDLERMYK